MCGIRPESLVSPEQVAPFFVTGTIFFTVAILRRLISLSKAMAYTWYEFRCAPGRRQTRVMPHAVECAQSTENGRQEMAREGRETAGEAQFTA